MKDYRVVCSGGTAVQCRECGMVTPVYERGEHHTAACSHRRGTYKHTPVKAVES